MPKITLALEGTVIKEAELFKERTTLGRRPYNDVVLDHLTVSGEHAVLSITDQQVFVEDLGSTNGTYVNGQVIRKQLLTPGDTLEIGKFSLTLTGEPPPAERQGVIKVLSGAAAGRELSLTKALTTFGKAGVAVASISRQPGQFLLQLVEGVEAPTLNGTPFGAEPVRLCHGDLIVLAGTQMQFLQL